MITETAFLLHGPNQQQSYLLEFVAVQAKNVRVASRVTCENLWYDLHIRMFSIQQRCWTGAEFPSIVLQSVPTRDVTNISRRRRIRMPCSEPPSVQNKRVRVGLWNKTGLASGNTIAMYRLVAAKLLLPPFFVYGAAVRSRRGVAHHTPTPTHR